jgi:hypothetical protein
MGSQIAAMDREVRCNLPQVIQNSLEGTQVAVNVRYDCNAHFALRRKFRCVAAVLNEDKASG